MKTNNFILAVLIALGLYACKEKENFPTPQETSTHPELRNFFDRNTASSQTFSVDVSSSSAMITASEGTTVMIPANAFVNTSGEATNGPVTIEVKEIYNQAGMVLSGITSVSSGKILESGGEIYINATAGGEQLFLAQDAEIIIGTPKSSTQNDMQLFEGKGEDENFDWEPVQQDTVNFVNDSVIGNPNGGNGNFENWFLYNDFFCTCYNATSYFVSIKNLGWCNIDRFYWQSSSVNVSINSPGFSNANSSVFVVLKNINSAINVYADIAYHNGSYGLTLPSGTETTVIAIGYKDGKFHYDVKDYTISDNLTIQLDLVETAEADITADINSMFDN